MSIKDTISRKIREAIRAFDFEEAIEDAMDNIDLEGLIEERLIKKIESIDTEPLLTDLVGSYIDNELDDLGIEDEVLSALQDAFEDL